MEQVIFAGAHPDDFIGSAGTALRMREHFGIHIWDFTKGERGLEGEGVSLEACARMRVAEELRVAQHIGAKTEFLGEIDGEAFAPRETCERMAHLLKKIHPRAVFTHWIPDRHSDHIFCTCALLKALRLAQLDPEIYFYEETYQSIGFQPHFFVDITPVMEEKKEIIRTYACQNPSDRIVKNKVQDALFRGSQILVRYAEAFASCGFETQGKRNIFQELPGVKNASVRGA